MLLRYFLTILCIYCFTTINAQNELIPERFIFEANLQYDNSIPSPAEFLGYELGEELTLYAHVEQYIKKLAELSNRIQIQSYGETYEGRKLYSLAISSAENINNLEELRSNNLKIMDPVGNPNIDLSQNDNPVFVSFSYNIHGNETSSTEAAMQVAYRLAAANDQETMSLLDQAVTIMYPCINADGRDRYVYWYKGTKRHVLGKEPRDMEHYAPFPNGRTNHYWFDLNRDWLWGVHPESRGHTSEYLRWMPQLHTDYHEMGYNNNYYTSPGTTPRNKLLPDDYERLSDTIGMANIKAFDEFKVNYFTREGFDFFYPGYGSSYPSVMGAIGMLVEQGGISGGRAVETDDGYVLTLRQRVYDHYRTSIATLSKAVDQKDLFITYGRNANDPSLSKSKTKAYVVKNDGNPYLSDFKKILLHHGIEIHSINSNTQKNLINYRTGKSEQTSLNEGDFVVNADQSKHLFIHSLMARNMIIEDSVMYDMSTWALPLAYNLNAYESLTDFASGALTKVSDSGATPTMASSINESTYAISIDWNQRNAPKALSHIWKKGYKVRLAEESFEKNGFTYPAGTLVILLGRNFSKIGDIKNDFESIAQNTGISFVAHSTGRMDKGVDFGSRKMRPLHAPKIGMLVGAPFNTYTSGQIYFLFDRETEYPIERIRTEILKQTAFPKFGSRYGYADLFDYDVIILPGGGNGLKELIDEENQKTWTEWMEAGGIVIATESAAEFFTKSKSKFTNIELQTAKKDTSEAALNLSYADRQAYFGKKRIPGSAFNSNVDTSNPLAFGMPDEVYTLKFSTVAIKPSVSLQSVVQYSKDKDQLLVAGYSSSANLETLSGGTSSGFASKGLGGIVYLLDNTQYRMFWRGPSRMMQNAAFFMR